MYKIIQYLLFGHINLVRIFNIQHYAAAPEFWHVNLVLMLPSAPFSSVKFGLAVPQHVPDTLSDLSMVQMTSSYLLAETDTGLSTFCFETKQYTASCSDYPMMV